MGGCNCSQPVQTDVGGNDDIVVNNDVTPTRSGQETPEKLVDQLSAGEDNNNLQVKSLVKQPVVEDAFLSISPSLSETNSAAVAPNPPLPTESAEAPKTPMGNPDGSPNGCCSNGALEGEASTVSKISQEDPEMARALALAVVDAAIADTDMLTKHGDTFGAERCIMDAVDSLSDLADDIRKEALQSLRQSKAYQEAARMIGLYEQGIKACLTDDAGGQQWQEAGRADLNLKDLGLAVDSATDAALKPEYRVVKIMYRKMPGQVEIRIHAMVPTQATNVTNPTLAGWVSMYHETEHYDTWQPTVHGKGPKELQPRQKFTNLWQTLTKVMWTKTSQISTENIFLNPDTGSFLLRVADVPSDDELWKRFPSPKGFPEDTTKITYSGFALPQKHTMFLSISIIAVMPKPLPDMILKFVITWVLPTIVKRMLKAVGASLCKDGPHNPKIEADAEGIYAKTRQLVAKAVSVDQSRGDEIFSSTNVPNAEMVGFRHKNLTNFEASQCAL